MNIGILLAAGVGRRINETMDISHKCFMKVNDVTFLENTLIQMDEVCDRIYIATGHKPEIIQEAVAIIRKTVDAEIYLVHNPHYATTNNVVTMYKVFDQMMEDNITVTNLFYAESDIYYTPHAEIFKALLEDCPGGNVRAAIWTPKGQAEWRIEWHGSKHTAIDYIDDDEAGICVIGAAKFNAEFTRSLIQETINTVVTNDQIYWDEAERVLLKDFDVFPLILFDDEIIEIDNENDFERAKKLGYDVSV